MLLEETRARRQSSRRASIEYSEALRRGSLFAGRANSSLSIRRPNPLEEKALSAIWRHTLTDVGKYGKGDIVADVKPQSGLPSVQSPVSSPSARRGSALRDTSPHQRRSSQISLQRVSGKQTSNSTVVSPYLSVVAPVVSRRASSCTPDVWRHRDVADQPEANRISEHGNSDQPLPTSQKPTTAGSHASSAGQQSTAKKSVGSHPSSVAEWEEQDSLKRQQAQQKHAADQWLLAREGERGNAWKVLELLQAGIEASSKDEDGRTACHFAAMNNHQQSLLALCFVDQEAYRPHDFEQQANDGGTALHYAAFNGCFQAVDTLIQQHRRKIQKDRTDILEGHQEDLRETQQVTRESKAQHKELEQALHDLQRQEVSLKQAIEGYKTGTVDGKAAQHKKRKEMRARQSELEAELDSQAESCSKLEQAVAHWKPISRAKHEAFKASLSAATKDLVAAQQALERHVKDTESQDKAHAKTMRKYARGIAKSEKKLRQVEHDLPILEQQVAESSRGLEALQRKKMAIRDEIKEYSRKVVVFPTSHNHIEFNADIHCRGADGSTPLHWAAEGGQDGIAKRLIELGADVHAKDKEGMTPLHWAAAAKANPRLIPSPKPLRRHVEVGVVLLSASADANDADLSGCTPLHVASSHGFTRFVRLLKEWGGDPKVVSAHGQLPTHFALGAGDMACAEALLHDEQDIVSALHLSDDNGLSALQLATLNGHAKEAVQLLRSCTTTLTRNVKEAKVQARRGFRDEPHKTMSQSYGAQIFSGSIAESIAYFHGTQPLTATRFSGWDRNDLVHPRSPPRSPASVASTKTAPDDHPGDVPTVPSPPKLIPSPSRTALIRGVSAKFGLTAAATWTEGLSGSTLRAMGLEANEPTPT